MLLAPNIQNKQTRFQENSMYGESCSYGEKALRKSRYYSQAIMFFLLCLVSIFFLPKLENVTIATQILKNEMISQQIVFRNVLPPLNYEEPKTKKLLSDTSSFIIYDRVEPIPKPVIEVLPKTPVLVEQKPIPEPIKEEVIEKTPEEIPKEIIDKPKPITQKEEKKPPIQEEVIQKKETVPVITKQENLKSTALETVDSSSSVESLQPTAISAEEERYAKEHALALLLHTIEKHKKYPKAAKRNHTEGIVKLVVTINDKGIVTAHSIQSSGVASVLEKATIELGKKLIGLNTNVKTGKSFQVIVPVAYKIH